MSTPIKLREPGQQARTYTFTCTFGSLAALLAAAALALTLFFVLGVLVGRGHRPEAVVPPIARMMPTEAPARADKPAELLKPEELGYAEQLTPKTQDPAPARAIDKVERKAPDKKTADKAAEKKPDAKTDLKAAKKDEKPADPDTRRYDYVYQAASFPDVDQAKAFLKKLKAAGVKCDMETGAAEGKSWNRIVVFFQGTPNDTRALKEKLNGLGVPKLLMRTKTPV